MPDPFANMPGNFFASREFRRPSWLQRIFAAAILIAIVALMIVIAIPVLVIAVAAVLIMGAIIWVRRLLTRSKAPGGAFDQRRNVRVVRRGDDQP